MKNTYGTVAVFDARYLRPDRREELVEWIQSLDIRPADVLERGVILQGENQYELHLTKYIRNERGSIQLDLARDEAVTEPLVVELGASPTWPAWLGGEPSENLAAVVDAARRLGLSLSRLSGAA